jgi:hypothetical protein
VFLGDRKMKYVVVEKQNANSTRTGTVIEAESLTGAKIAASKSQAFHGTTLEILNDDGQSLAMKDRHGDWVDFDHII